MMLRSIHGKTIEHLPDELILETFEILAASEPKHWPLNDARFRIFHALSRVCRRFRAIALMFIQRDIVCKTSYELWELFYPKVHLLKYHVRSIRCGRPIYPHLSNIELSPSIQASQLSSFPGLISFECSDLVVTEKFLQTWLKCCGRLRNLVMLWHDMVAFPHMEDIPSVRTLRIYLCGHGRPSGDYDPDPNVSVAGYLPYKNLITLELFDRIELVPSQVIVQCMKLSFPKLRVLRLGGVETPVPPVYNFIHRHPTLMEVNITFTVTRSLHFEPLVKLIDGTGTWMQPPEIGSLAGVKLDKPSNDELGSGPVPHPIGFYNNFSSFAFSRKPRSQSATEWQDWRGSSFPRYECTGLAIYFHTHPTTEQEEQCDDLTTFLTHLNDYGLAGSLGELRVCSHVVPRNRDFVTFLTGLPLKSLGPLRTFTFHAPCPHPDDTNRGVVWDASELPTVFPGGVYSGQAWLRSFEDAMCVYLDEPYPPAFPQEAHDPVPPRTLSDLCYNWDLSELEQDMLERAIRLALQLESDAELDGEDTTLLLRAWEAHNYRRVAKCVRHVATECTTLEELEWYVADGFATEALVWKWKILRREDGTVDRVVGTLSWTGSSQGDPQPFPVFVGQEQEHTRYDSGGYYES